MLCYNVENYLHYSFVTFNLSDLDLVAFIIANVSINVGPYIDFTKKVDILHFVFYTVDKICRKIMEWHIVIHWSLFSVFQIMSWPFCATYPSTSGNAAYPHAPLPHSAVELSPSFYFGVWSNVPSGGSGSRCPGTVHLGQECGLDVICRHFNFHTLLINIRNTTYFNRTFEQ